MRGRGAYGVLFVCLSWLALLAGLPVPASADPEGGKQGAERMRSGELESTLVVDADRSGRFRLRSQSTVRVSAEERLIEQLMRESLLPEERHHEWLGSGLRLFGGNRLYWQPGQGDIEGGSFSATTTDVGQEFVGVYARVDPFLVDWDDALTIRSAKPLQGSPAQWTVTIELDEVAVLDADPLPDSLVRDGSSTSVSWRFDRGEAERIRLELDPPQAVELVAGLVGGGWDGVLALGWLLLAAAFLPTLYLLLGRRRFAGESLAGSALRRQVSLLCLALLFAVLALTAEVVRRKVNVGVVPFENWPLDMLAFDLLPLLFAVAFAGAIQSASRAPAEFPWVLAAAAFAGLLLVFFMRMAAPDEAELTFGWKSQWPAVAIGALGWFVLVCLVVNGIMRIAAAWIGRPGLSPRTSRLLGLLTVPLVAGMGVASGVAYSGYGLDLLHNGYVVIPITVVNLIHAASGLLPLAILPGALFVLSRSIGGEPFLVRRRRLFLLALALYVFFVVTSTGMFAGLPSPGSLLIGAAAFGGLALLRRARLDRVDDELARANPGAGAPAKSLLVERKRELLERAFVIERVRRRRTAAHHEMAKAEVAGAGFVSYRDSLAELDDAERYLQEGAPPAGRRPSAADRQLVRLLFPPRPRVAVAALGCGPGRGWRENGELALRYGAWLAILPIAYVLFVLASNELGSVFDPYYGFELIAVGSLLAGELALWVVAAYVFGCLFSWLPGANGPLKGLALSLPVLAGVGLLELCPLYAGMDNWGFRCAQILAFLTVLGLVMDWRTLRVTGLGLRDLPDLYQVRSVRFGVVNLAPLLVAALSIYQQFRTGDPQGAVEQALRAAPGQLPGIDQGD